MICFFIITLFSVSVSGVDIIHCDIKSCRKFSTQTSSWFTFKKKLKKKLFKQVDRKLHSGEVQSETSLGRSSWTATQSVGKMLPLAKNKVCMCTQRWRHIFKMLLLHWLNKGKTQSGSVASSVEVIVEMPGCKQLAVAAASEHSCMRLNRYLNHSEAYQSLLWQRRPRASKIQGLKLKEFKWWNFQDGKFFFVFFLQNLKNVLAKLTAMFIVKHTHTCT